MARQSRPRPDAAATDVKRRRIGRRSRTVPIVTGLRSAEVPVADQVEDIVRVYAFETAEPHRSSVPLELLKRLHDVGTAYHAARVELDQARRAAETALFALTASDTRELWRDSVRVCFDAADGLDAAAKRLGGLIGVVRVADAAEMAANALTDIIRVGELADPRPDGSLPRLHANMQFREALKHLVHRDELVAERARRLQALDIKSDHVRLYARGFRRRIGIRDVLGKQPSDRDRLYVHTLDAASPIAPGSIGVETIVAANAPWIAGLTSPWSVAAWWGWCCAGRGLTWTQSWDSWELLSRVPDVVRGRARGATGNNKQLSDAVGRSRRRTPL